MDSHGYVCNETVRGVLPTPILELSAGEDGRRKKFFREAINRRLARVSDEGSCTWDCKVAVCNVTQNADFQNQIDVSALPTIMKRSKLFDLVSGRLLSKEELFLAHGHPHPALTDLHGDRFAWDVAFVDSLTYGQTSSLIGNSMHLCAVGAVVSYVLGFAASVDADLAS